MRILMVALLGWLAGAQLALADVNVRSCVPEPGTTDIAYGDLVNCDINPIGDSDLFRFTGQAGEVANILMTYRGGPGDPCFRIVEPDGTIGGFICANGQRAVEATVKLTKSGIYQIQAVDGANNQLLDYSLVLERLFPTTPNATALPLGRVLPGEINPVGDIDLYSFNASSGETLVAIVAFYGGPGDPCFRIIEPDGAVGGYVCANGQRAVETVWRTSKPGTYGIQVVDGADNQTLSYAIALERLSPVSPNARPLTWGQIVTGEINPVGDAKLYYFNGSAGDTVAVTVGYRGGPGDPCFRFADPDGVVGGYICANGPRAVSADVKLTKAGAYSIEVVDGSHNQILSYSVEGQCFGQCPPLPPPSCTYSLAPAMQVVAAIASTGSIGLVTSPGCAWTAASNASQITISSGLAGNGPGVVQYSVAANTAAASRVGTLTIAGQTATVTQSGTAPLLILSPNSLTFGVREGSTVIADQVVSVFTNAASLNFSASAAGGSWLTVSPANGSAPASVVVSINPRGLTDGTYQGTITVNASVANPSSVTVPVRLTVNSAGPPKFGFNSDGLTFSFAQGAAARTVQRSIANAGGGTLNFEASARSTPGNWLRVSPDHGQVTLDQQASLAVTADPIGLSPGTYAGSIHVAAGGEQRDLPVTMTVSQVRQSILLSQSGLTFIAVANGGPAPSQGVGVLNFGQGLMDWRASVTTLTGGANWLSVSPTSGTTDASSLQVPPFDVNVNAAGLAAGEYYGQVRVEAPAADNSPQFVSVVLQVFPAGSDPGPVVRPTGLVFTGVAGAAAPAFQSFRISNLTNGTKTFASGRLTIDGGSWLAVNPPAGNVTPAQPTTLQVNAASTGLTPGIRRGVLTLLFADGAVRTVNILFVLSTGGGGNTSQHAAEGNCTPTRLLPLVTSLGGGFTVAAGWPNLLEARVVDDCGNAFTGGSVVATFSNGDVPLPLVSLKDGRWVRDWTAKRTDVSQVTVTISAEDSSRQIAGRAEVSGALQANPEPPVMASGGVLNAASFQLGGPVSLGGMVSLFGSKLSRGQDKSPNLPLQTELAGALATIGGKVMPLIVATEGQINAVVPYDLPVNTQVPVIVRQGNRYTVPEMVTVAPAQPAVFTADGTGKGQGIIINAEGQIAEPGQAAAAGSAIVIYTTGLGPVAPPVDAGKAAPTSPLSRASNEVTLTIGGVNAQVLFAGLVPGFTGFYQVNAVVPREVTPGPNVEVVLTVGNLSSPPVTMAVR